MATEPDKALTPSLRAEAVPNWRLFKTTCSKKVRWCDLEYTQKMHLWPAFSDCFATFCYVWVLFSSILCKHCMETVFSALSKSPSFLCIFSVDSFWRFHSCYRNSSLYSIFLAHCPDHMLCICEQIYCLVQIYKELYFHFNTSLFIDSVY